MRLEQFRLQKTWTQEELAEAANLNVRTIQRAERGDSISGSSLKKLAQALEVDISDIEIGRVTLTSELIDKKIAVQLENVKVTEDEEKIRIEIRTVLPMPKLVFALMLIGATGASWFLLLVSDISPDRQAVLPFRFYILQAIFYFSVPLIALTWLKHRFGVLTIEISPELFRRSFRIGVIQFSEQCFESELLSGFSIRANNGYFAGFIGNRNYYFLEFQHGFKPKSLKLTVFESEARFVLKKIEQVLQPE